MRSGELVLGELAWSHAVALLDLVLVRDRLTAELPGGDVETDDLRSDPVPPAGRQLGFDAAVEVRDQVAGVVGQCSQRARLARSLSSCSSGGP